MSDSQRMPELPKEVIDGIRVFDEGRLKLFQWLSIKTEQDVSVRSYATKAEKLVAASAEIFAETSTTVVEAFPNQRKIAGFVIANAWFIDSQERAGFLAKRLPSTVEIATMERPPFERRVSQVLSQYEDLGVIHTELGSSYFKFIASDINEFLNECHDMREQRIVRMTSDMELTTDESFHFEPDAAGFGAWVARQSVVELREVLDLPLDTNE